MIRIIVLLCALALAIPAHASIIIINGDDPGEGFNDSTPAVPVGGNTGITVGQQRLNAFEFAADIWESILDIFIPVQVVAKFDPLPCQTTSGVLGSAGPSLVTLNFVGAPRLNTWYVVALANQLAGVDLFPTQSDISATFQSNVGTPGCLATSSWYYGLDNQAAPGQIDLVVTLLHEFAHGLGFLSLANEQTGALFGGQIDVYSLFLFDRTVGKSWSDMSDGERVQSAINTGNLVWTGARVTTAAATLSSGQDAEGRLKVFAPNPVRSGSSISHWTGSASPDLLMEPFIVSGIPHEPDLAKELFGDVGWPLQEATPVVGAHVMFAGRHDGTVRVELAPFGVRTVELHRTEQWGERRLIDVQEDIGASRIELVDPSAPNVETEYWVQFSSDGGASGWAGPIHIQADAFSGLNLRVAGENPARGTVALRAYLSSPGPAHLAVYDIRGRLVKELTDSVLPAGWHPLNWDRTDRNGQTVPRGVYAVRLRSGGRVVTTRVLLAR